MSIDFYIKSEQEQAYDVYHSICTILLDAVYDNIMAEDKMSTETLNKLNSWMYSAADNLLKILDPIVYESAFGKEEHK